MNVQDKVVVVTGANSGIGRVCAGEFAARGARVVLASRNREKNERAAQEIRQQTGSDVSIVDLDLSSLSSVKAAAETILAECDSVDVLLNNAGLMLDSRRLSPQGFELTFATNHLGHFLLTELLLPGLKKAAQDSGDARIVNVSSEAHRAAFRGLPFEDLNADRGYRSIVVYGRSKLANILHTVALTKRLHGTNVTANALHPGVIATDFGAADDMGGVFSKLVKLVHPLLMTPTQGAQTSLHLCTAAELRGVSGKYFANKREKRPSNAARDITAAEQLWSVSSNLVGEWLR